MLWADRDYVGEGKMRKCGISTAEAKGTWQDQESPHTKATLFPLYRHLPLKVAQ